MANTRPDHDNTQGLRATHSALRLRQQALVNRTGDLGKYIVRVGANEPHCTYHNHQNHGEHHGILSDILASIFTTKSPQVFHTLLASLPRCLPRGVSASARTSELVAGATDIPLTTVSFVELTKTTNHNTLQIAR